MQDYCDKNKCRFSSQSRLSCFSRKYSNIFHYLIFSIFPKQKHLRVPGIRPHFYSWSWKSQFCHNGNFRVRWFCNFVSVQETRISGQSINQSLEKSLTRTEQNSNFENYFAEIKNIFQIKISERWFLSEILWFIWLCPVFGVNIFASILNVYKNTKTITR